MKPVVPASELARRWREAFTWRVTRLPAPPPGLFAPPPPDSEDLLEPLRRVTSG